METGSLEYLVEDACKALLSLNENLSGLEVSHHDDADEDEEFSGICISATTSDNLTMGTNAMSRRLDRLEVEIEVRGMIFDETGPLRDSVWKEINAALLSPNASAGTLPIFAPATTPFRSFMVEGESKSSREDNDARRTHTRKFGVLASIG